LKLGICNFFLYARARPAILSFMDKTTERGEAAFPTIISGDCHTQLGITLRDWFAGQALQAMMAQMAMATDVTDEKIAAWSYEAADAMLSEREKGGGDE
jgi:hypothetical protein